MKKVIRMFMVLLLLLWALPFVGALAEAAAGDIEIPMPTEYMKPEDFATFAGQVVFVVALVQFLKIPADGLFGGHIKTEYVVYVVAFLGQVLARMILPSVAGVLSWGALPTMLLWAFCVAWAAMKSYKVVIAQVEEKKVKLTSQSNVE